MYNLRTRPISRRLFSGKFKDPLTTRYKTFKNRLNSKVLCFMYFLNPEWVLHYMQQAAELDWNKNVFNDIACRVGTTIGLVSPVRESCFSV